MNLNTYIKKQRERFKRLDPHVQPAHEQDKGHFYISPKTGEKYHSVTYFTSFIKDPSLANWRMNRALAYIKEKIHVLDPNFIDQYIEEAKSAPEGQFMLAGDIGTQTHSWRQQLFQAWIDSGEGQISEEEIDSWSLPEGAQVEVISGCRAIKKFLKETGYIPIACELPLVDDKLWVGGTIDDIGIFPNKYKKFYDEIPELKGGYREMYKPQVVFVDLKTSNQGHKPSYAFQVRGFYQRMIRQTFGIRPKKTYILHTSKEDGTYKLIDLTEMKFLEKDAAYLVHCSRSWDKAVEAFKPKIITI